MLFEQNLLLQHKYINAFLYGNLINIFSWLLYNNLNYCKFPFCYIIWMTYFSCSNFKNPCLPCISLHFSRNRWFSSILCVVVQKSFALLYIEMYREQIKCALKYQEKRRIFKLIFAIGHSVFTILLSLGREMEMEKMLRNHILFSIL